MGDEAQFHFGRKRPQDGLEFIASAKSKRSSFRQATAHFEARSHRSVQHPSGRHTPEPASDLIPQQEAYELPQEEMINYHLAAASAHEAPINQQLAPDRSLDMPLTLADPLDNIYQEPLLTPHVAALGASEGTEASLQSPQPQQALVGQEDRIIDLYEDTKEKVKLRKTRKVLSYTLALAALIILALSVLFIRNNGPAIPSSIRKKAAFTVYEMAPNPTFKVDKKSVQLAAEGNLVFFVDNPANKAHFVINQQSIPEIAKDDKDYQQLLSDYDKYADTNAPIGKAYFTRPPGIGTDISVFIKTEKTLVIIRGPGTTSDTDWTSLLTTLRVAK